MTFRRIGSNFVNDQNQMLVTANPETVIPDLGKALSVNTNNIHHLRKFSENGPTVLHHITLMLEKSTGSLSFFATVPTVGNTQIIIKGTSTHICIKVAIRFSHFKATVVARVDRGEYGFARIYGNDGSYFQVNVTKESASDASFTDVGLCQSGCPVTLSTSELRQLLEGSPHKYDNHFPQLRRLGSDSTEAVFDQNDKKLECTFYDL